MSLFPCLFQSLRICVLFVTLCQWFSCPCRCLPVFSKVSLYVSRLLLSVIGFPVLVHVALSLSFQSLPIGILFVLSVVFLSLSMPSVCSNGFLYVHVCILFLILWRCFSCLSPCFFLFVRLFCLCTYFLSFPLCRVFCLPSHLSPMSIPLCQCLFLSVSLPFFSLDQ